MRSASPVSSSEKQEALACRVVSDSAVPDGVENVERLLELISEAQSAGVFEQFHLDAGGRQRFQPLQGIHLPAQRRDAECFGGEPLRAALG